MQTAMWHAGCHGAAEAAESSNFVSIGSRKREPMGLAWAFETPELTLSDILPPIWPHLLQQSHNSNPFQVVPLPDDQPF